MPVCPNCGTNDLSGGPACIACHAPWPAGRAVRQGDRFMVLGGPATLPPFCVKCDAPSRPEGWKATFYWHNPALYLLVLLNIIIYMIVAMIVRKRWDLVVPICEMHFRRRRTLRWSSLFLFLGAIVVAIAGAVTGNNTVIAATCITASLASIASLVALIVAERTLRPTEITPTSAQFAGACPAFLARLD